MTDVAPVQRAIEVNVAQDVVGALLCQLGRVTHGRHAQHAPACRQGDAVMHGRARMKNMCIRHLRRQALHRITTARLQRITVRRHHHAESNAAIPGQLDLIERPVGGMHQHVEQIALEPHHDGLRFRVTHAAVELHGARVALRIDHQPGVQETGEHDAVAGHAVDRREDDFLHHLGMHVRGDHRCGRVSTHAAGVRPFVVVEQALVILAGGERHHIPAITQHDEAGLLAFEEFFNHDTRLLATVCGVVVLHAERIGFIHQHPVDGLMRLPDRGGHDHALACRQPVGLDDDRRAVQIDIGMRGRCIGKGRERGSGYLVALHEGLGKGLRAFKLGSSLGRPENAHAACAKQINHATGQRRLGTDDRQHDLLRLSKVGQRVEIGDRHIAQLRIGFGAAVARRHVHGLYLR